MDNAESKEVENPETQAETEAVSQPETQPPAEHTHSHAEGVPPMEEACKREVEVEIPADVVTRQQEALVQQYS
ncbi:MAG: hypothetical protein WA738_01460, partial [Candidatus Angelobacter sp.]